MVKWNIEVDGKKLREAIDNCQDKKNQAELILILRNTIKETINKLTEYYTQIGEEDVDWELSELNEIYELLDGDDEIVLLDDYEISDVYGFNNSEELVDERLARFYDECDYKRIWISF